MVGSCVESLNVGEVYDKKKLEYSIDLTWDNQTCTCTGITSTNIRLQLIITEREKTGRVTYNRIEREREEIGKEINKNYCLHNYYPFLTLNKVSSNFHCRRFMMC